MKSTALQRESGKTRVQNVHLTQGIFSSHHTGPWIAWLFCGVMALTALTNKAMAQSSVNAEPATSTQAEMTYPAELEAGFHLLYELKPAEARAQFDAWQHSHPEDPLGPALQAANYLLQECYHQGVLTSEFFLEDKRSGKNQSKPDPEQRSAFFAAHEKALELARARLKVAPNDVNALFAITMSLGMQADYAGLIDKRQPESLGMMKDSANYARELLDIDPRISDAYLALGAANYIVGSLSGTQRFFLGFKGIHGNAKEGLQQLEIAATRGHYLRPFAKMLLALADLRQKKPELARAQLAELAAEFPANPLFASELAKLNGAPVSAMEKTSP